MLIEKIILCFNMKISLKNDWKGKMSFETKIGNHTIVMDAAPDSGGDDSGVRPKPLILAALAGCTGMDVVSILAKMKVTYSKLSIITDGEINDEHPKKFNDINVIFSFEGDNLPVDKIENAINLSKDKYCGVAATLKDSVRLTYQIMINGDIVKSLT